MHILETPQAATMDTYIQYARMTGSAVSNVTEVFGDRSFEDQVPRFGTFAARSMFTFQGIWE